MLLKKILQSARGDIIRCWIEIDEQWSRANPRDARGLRLKPQDRVDVVSRRGRVRGIELRVTETVAPGQIFVPFHYAEANANEVTQSAFDPFSREPNYKHSAARVEKAPREGVAR